MARRWPLLAPFEVRVRARPDELAGCFKAQRDVTVSCRWPRSNAPRRWFIARIISDHELRLRIAPKQTDRPSLGNVRAPIDLELRLCITEANAEEGATVEVRLAPVITAGFYGYFLFPGVGIMLGAWALFGLAIGIPVAVVVLLAIVWPRRLFEDAKELRSKLSAALGPVLLEKEIVAGYRAGGLS